MGEWSALNEYGAYQTYQNDIADDLAESGTTPLMWELEHRHRAVEYYG